MSNIINLFNRPFDYNKNNGVSSNSEVKITKEDEAILQKNIEEVIKNFTKGNMTIEELALWCNGNKCEVKTATDENNMLTITFDFQGKSYRVRTNKDAAKSSNDNITVQTYTLDELTNIYKLDQATINLCFDEVASTDGKENLYALRDSSYLATLNLISIQEEKSDTTYSATDLQGFDNKVISEFFDKSTIDGKTVYTLKAGKTYAQFTAALAKNLETNPDIQINKSGIPGYSYNSTSALETSGSWTTTKNLASTAKNKALEYLDKNVKSELKTNFLTKYKFVLSELGYSENDLATLFETMYNSAKSNIATKVENLSEEILTSGSVLFFVKAWVNVNPTKLVDTFLAEFNKQVKTVANEASNKANNNVKTETEEINDSKAEKERRINHSNTILDNYRNQLEKYADGINIFNIVTADTVEAYLNGNINDSEFEKAITAHYNSIKAEAEADIEEARKEAEAEEAKRAEEAKKAEEAEKTRRNDYSKQVINNYKEQLQQYDGAVDKFNDATADSLNKYLNNEIDDKAFESAVKACFDSIKAEAEEAKRAEEAKKAEEAEKTRRNDYSKQVINNYKEQLQQYDGAVDKFNDATADSLNKYLNNEIDDKAFESAIKASFDSIKAEAEEAKRAEEAKKAEEAEKTRRNDYSKQVINNYKEQLQQYDGAVDKFNDATADSLNKYLNNEIDDKAFESAVKACFDSIKAEAEENLKEITIKNPDGSTTKTTKNDDGTKLVQNFNSKNLLVSDVLYDANGKKIEERQMTYDSNGKISTRITDRYNSDGSYTRFTYSASTGAVTRKDFDKNGKDVTVSAYSQINKGKIYKEALGISITRTTQQMYNYITQDLDNTFAKKWFVKISTRQAMQIIAGDHTIALLEAAQIGQGKPAGANKQYSSLAETGFEDYIRKNIENTIKINFGYEPEDVNGYFFDSNSSLAKAMAADSDMAAFVKKNIKDLIAGKNLPKGLGFTSDADLYNAVASAVVLDSKLSGTTLTLKVYDLYDFDPKFITSVNDNSGIGTIMNAAGAAAMKDGKLKPYYHITEVKIDLKTIFNDTELRDLGII